MLRSEQKCQNSFPRVCESLDARFPSTSEIAFKLHENLTPKPDGFLPTMA